jgi:protein-disulfide isomerase
MPVPRPIWQNPTAIVTALAVIATIILVIVLNSKGTAAPTSASLIPPANPVAASIPRQGASLGSTSAPVKVDAWEDYQCPYCQIWTIQWEPHVIDDFVATGIVLYQFHDYAFIGTGHSPDESLAAAVAAQCAGDQGKFWEYHGWLYANQNPAGENKGRFTRTTIDAIAGQVGLDRGTFDTCLADPAKAAAVGAEQTAGTALGINSTPSIFVNGKAISLTTYTDLAALIRSLAPASPGASAPASTTSSPAGSPTPSGSAVP